MLDDNYLGGLTEGSSSSSAKQELLSSKHVINNLSGCVLKTEPVGVCIENVSEELNRDSNIPKLSNETKGWYVPAVSGNSNSDTNSQSNDVKVLSASSFKPPISMFSCHSCQSPILKVVAEAKCSSLPALSNNLPSIPPGEVSLPSFATVEIAQDRSFPIQVMPSIHSPVASAGFMGSAPSSLTSAGFESSDNNPLMSAASQGLALPKVSNDKESRCRISPPSAYDKQHSVPSDILWTDEPQSQLNLSKRRPPKLKRNHKKMVSVGVQCRCLFIPIIKTEPLDADNEISPAVSSNLQSILTDNDIVPNNGDKNVDISQKLLCKNKIGFTGTFCSKQRDDHVSTGSWLEGGSGTGSKVDEQISGPDIRDLGRCSKEHSAPMIIDLPQKTVESELGTCGLEMDVSCADLTDSESSGLEDISDAGSCGDDSLANLLGDASRPTFCDSDIDAISEETTIVKCEEDASADTSSFQISSSQQRKLKGTKRKSGRLSGKKSKLPGPSSKRLHRVHGNKKKMLQSNQDDMLKETSGRRPRERKPGRKVPQQNNQEPVPKGALSKDSQLWEVSSKSSAWKKRKVLVASTQGQMVKEAPLKKKRGRPAGRKTAEPNIPETSSQSFKVVANEKEVASSGSSQYDLDKEKLQPVILRSGRKRFNCQHCSKCFSSASQCALHEKEAHAVFTCDECSEAFSSKEEIQRHYHRKHKGKNIRFSKEIPGCSSDDESDTHRVSDQESDDNFQCSEDMENNSVGGDNNDDDYDSLEDTRRLSVSTDVQPMVSNSVNSSNKPLWCLLTVEDVKHGLKVKGRVKVNAIEVDVKCVQLDIQRTLMEMMIPEPSNPECPPAYVAASGIENQPGECQMDKDRHLGLGEQRKGDTLDSPQVKTSNKAARKINRGVNECVRENSSGGPNIEGKNTTSSVDEQFGEKTPGCHVANENMRGGVDKQVQDASPAKSLQYETAGTGVAKQDRKNTIGSPVEDKNSSPGSPGQDKNSPGSPGQDKNSSGSPGQDKNSPGSPGQDKNSPGSPGQDKNYPGSPGQDKNYSSGSPGQDKNSSGRPVEEKNSSGSLVEDKNYSGSPVEDKNSSGSPVEDKNSSGSPVEDKTAREEQDKKNLPNTRIVIDKNGKHNVCEARAGSLKMPNEDNNKKTAGPTLYSVFLSYTKTNKRIPTKKTDLDFDLPNHRSYKAFDENVIRTVCSKIKQSMQRKTLLQSSYGYCLEVRETTFKNSVKGFVQLKQELTSEEQKKLKEKLRENLEEIHRRVRGNVPYQPAEVPDDGDLSNADYADKETTGTTHSNQLSTNTERANNRNKKSTEIANHNHQLSGCVSDTSDQLYRPAPMAADSSDQPSPCIAGSGTSDRLSTSTFMGNSSEQLGHDMGHTSDPHSTDIVSANDQLSTTSILDSNDQVSTPIADTGDKLSTCIFNISDKKSTNIADTNDQSGTDIADPGVNPSIADPVPGVNPSIADPSNAKTSDTINDANTTDKLETGNLLDQDSKADTNPGFQVDFSTCKDPIPLQQFDSTKTSMVPVFNVTFDSLEKETLLDISEKLYNSLRVCLHHRCHEMCCTRQNVHSSLFSDISGVWAGHLDSRYIDRDGVFRTLGKKDYSSKTSIDSWKMFKKSNDFCYSLVVENKTIYRPIKENRRKRFTEKVECVFLTQQEITDFSSVKSLIKKSLKRLDDFYQRSSDTFTTNSNRSNAHQTVGDPGEARRSEEELTLVQEQNCIIAGKTALSSSHPQGGVEDISGKAQGIPTINLEPATDKSKEPGPEKLLASGDISSLSDIPDYSVTLSKYCKHCYIDHEKWAQKDRVRLRIHFSSVSIDEKSLDDITLNIYKTLRMARYRGIFLRNFMTVKQMGMVIQDMWDNKCDISLPELLLLHKVRERGIFWCEECKVPLANISAVDEHIGLACHSTRGQSQSIKKTCPICPKYFTSHLVLLHHRISMHHHKVLLPFSSHTTTKVPCPHCKKLLTKTAMSSHLQKMHQHPKLLDEPVLCNQCGKLLRTKEDIIKHHMWHERHRRKSRVLPCPYCSMTIKANKLAIHLLTHENTRPFSCGICQKSFKLKITLDTHMKCCHSDVREFACPVCGKEFRLKAHMLCHLRLHTGDLFECQVCRRSFTSKAHLNVHLRDLHPQKAEFYTCKVCGEEFSKLKFLNKHIEVEHLLINQNAVDSDKIGKPTAFLDGQLFKCDHCNEKFTKIYYLRRHILSAHSDGDEEKNRAKNARTQKVVKVNEDNKAVKKKMTKSAKVSVDKDGDQSKVAGKKQQKCNMPKDPAPINTEEIQSAKRKTSETRGSVKRIKMQHNLRSSSGRTGTNE